MAENDEKFEVVNVEDDLLRQIADASARMEAAAPGSKERQVEADIYTNLLRELHAQDKSNAQLANEYDKIKTERRTLWARVAVVAGEAAATIGLGWAYLKVNMKYGGMVGKDGQSIWKTIKNIKF